LASTTGVLSVGSTAVSSTAGTVYSLTLTAAPAAGGSSAASGAIPLYLSVAPSCTCSGAAQLTALMAVLLMSIMATVSM